MVYFSRQAAWLAVLMALVVLVAIFSGSMVSRHRGALAAEIEPVVITPARSSRPVTLRDRLVTGLRARLKSEIAFVDAVVSAVKLGQLPQRLVDESYFWARVRAADPRYRRPRRPIIFFQPAMTARAKRLGVDL